MTRSACNTIGTVLALSLAAFGIGGCQNGPAASMSLETDDGSGSLEPSPTPGTQDVSNADALASRTDTGKPSASTPDSSETPPVPVGISDSNNTGDTTANGGSGGSSGTVPPDPSNGCWQLPVVTRARLLAAPGRGQDLVGGKLMGSNSSAMNGFTDLAVISAAPGADGWVELPLANTSAYRYVKYYGAPGSHGVLAELELYSGDTRLSGDDFGISDTNSNVHGFALALDGNPATYFEGSQPNDGYVGLDLALGHIAASPTISPPPGVFRTAQTITLQAEAGATVRYTIDGSDPSTNGITYTGPVALPARTTMVKSVASYDCALPSTVTQSIYSLPDTTTPPGQPKPIQSSMHIGNSLTDTIVNYLEGVAQSGGIQLDFNRYTIPGAGTWLYDTNPTGGFGVDNVQTTLRSRPFDHLSMQPFPNEPCQISPSTGNVTDPGPDSDSGYVDQAWKDALSQNPNVQLWVYQQWPDPLDFTNCITGGGYTRGDWAPSTPADWNAAVQNELLYDEELVDVLMTLEPNAPRPYIVPGGLGLIHLREAIEAGQLPGYTNFFGQIFSNNGLDIHLTPPGAYYITLIFYATMFQSNPINTAPDPSIGLSDQQALVLQQLAWETVTGYTGSGVMRTSTP